MSRCERCGKSRDEHTKTNFIVNGYESRDIGWITLRAGNGYQRDIDLCKECMLKLSVFLNGPIKSVRRGSLWEGVEPIMGEEDVK